MIRPLMQIGDALVNINAIAAAKRTSQGVLIIRLTDGKSLFVTKETADIVWNALMPLVTDEITGAPDAVLTDMPTV